MAKPVKDLTEENTKEFEQVAVEATRSAMPPVGQQWKKGQSGNPGGIPNAALEGLNLDQVLAKVLGIRGSVNLARELVKLAMSDQITPSVKLNAIEYIFDRLEGKARQMQIEVHDASQPLLELVKQLHDENNKALEGRTVVLELPTESFDEAEVREVTSEDSGAAIQG